MKIPFHIELSHTRVKGVRCLEQKRRLCGDWSFEDVLSVQGLPESCLEERTACGEHGFKEFEDWGNNVTSGSSQKRTTNTSSGTSGSSQKRTSRASLGTSRSSQKRTSAVLLGSSQKRTSDLRGSSERRAAVLQGSSQKRTSDHRRFLEQRFFWELRRRGLRVIGDFRRLEDHRRRGQRRSVLDFGLWRLRGRIIGGLRVQGSLWRFIGASGGLFIGAEASGWGGFKGIMA